MLEIVKETKDLIAIAEYIEKLHGCELQLIGNRLSWLFVSQSFTLAAYAVSLNNTEGNQRIPIIVLRIILPIFGIISCSIVWYAVRAATAVADQLTPIRKTCGLRLCNGL